MRSEFSLRCLQSILVAVLAASLAGCGIISEFRQGLAESTRQADGGAGASSNAAGAIRPSPTPPVTPTLTAAPTSAFDIDPAQLKGVSISFWHPWGGAVGDVVADLAAEFNRSNAWGINIVPRALGGFDGVAEAVAGADEPPNVTATYLYQALEWRPVDLSPYADDPDWGLGAAQADYYPVFWEHDALGGKRLGLPAQGAAQVLYYNVTLGRELGFNGPPATPQEFQQQACTSTLAYLRDDDPQNDHKGGWIISTDYRAALGWLYGFGATVVKADGSGYTFDTPAVQEAFTYLRGLLNAGCAWISESDPPEAEFASRQGLFRAGSVAGIPFQESAFVDAGSRDEWSAIPFPSEDGDGVMPVYGPSFQVLPSTQEEQLASWLFIKWMTEPAQQAALAQVSANFPVRASSLGLMGVLPAAHPQWKSALDSLPDARHEPQLASWRIVRWAVSDAATQLFRYYFEIDRVATLSRLLDQTANDLNSEFK